MFLRNRAKTLCLVGCPFFVDLLFFFRGFDVVWLTLDNTLVIIIPAIMSFIPIIGGLLGPFAPIVLASAKMHRLYKMRFT